MSEIESSLDELSAEEALIQYISSDFAGKYLIKKAESDLEKLNRLVSHFRECEEWTG